MPPRGIHPRLGARAIVVVLGRTTPGRSDRRAGVPVRHPRMGSGPRRCRRPGDLIRSDVRRSRSDLRRLGQDLRRSRTAGRLIDSLRRCGVRG
jgi:hypothetical protein